MKLYLLTQTKNNDYDTYDSCVVCAENEESAKLIRPDGYTWDFEYSYSWVTNTDYVKAEYIGEAAEALKEGIVLSSYNAG
jgi:hypothetical protein